MTPRADVLITYAWCRSSYTAMRSLHSMGLRLAVADIKRTGMSQWSRFCSFAGCYASPLTNPEQFISDVIQLLNKTGANFILPGHDETEILAKYRKRLPSSIILPVATVDQLNLANDKARITKFADLTGVPIPQTFNWSNISDLSKALSEVCVPLVVKLRRSNGSKGTFYPDSSRNAVEIIQDLITKYRLKPDRYPIVQERVNGEGWGVSCLYWYGERIAYFTHRRLREKTPNGGTSTLRVSARNPILENYTFNLLDSLNWHGLAMVEYKYNPEADRGWFIEINPRLWGSIHLAVSSGVDFPALLYRSATDNPSTAKKYVKEQKDGLIARWYLGDVMIAVSEMYKGKFKSAIRLILPGQSDVYDDVKRDDLGAFFGQSLHYLIGFLHSRNINPVEDQMVG